MDKEFLVKNDCLQNEYKIQIEMSNFPKEEINDLEISDNQLDFKNLKLEFNKYSINSEKINDTLQYDNKYCPSCTIL